MQNLPYGIFSDADPTRRVGVAIGDSVLDLTGLATATGLPQAATLSGPTLNPFLARGPAEWHAVRDQLRRWLTDEAYRLTAEPFLRPAASVTMHLPIEVADYVDFYSSEQHATNVGRIFRPDGAALQPNWRHLPVGYHGRAGTVVVSGTPVVRPSGQRREPGDAVPVFGPSVRLDIEAEVGFVVGVPSSTPVAVESFPDHVFGAVLLNDWSARDIQAWETVPLGPFLGKSFATSISAWIVPLDALQVARVPGPALDPQPLFYLREVQPWGLDLTLEVELNGTVIARPPFAGMYWSPAQQLAHLTVNGASLRTGDLYGSGTVSGAAPDQRGSLLELSWNGRDAITLADGSTRTFLADGDTVVLRATAPAADGARVGFGEVRGTILPARS